VRLSDRQLGAVYLARAGTLIELSSLVRGWALQASGTRWVWLVEPTLSLCALCERLASHDATIGRHLRDEVLEHEDTPRIHADACDLRDSRPGWPRVRMGADD